MNGVIGMTDLMLDSELTSEQRENLGIIKSSGDALLAVINDILDFSKIEAGKLELDPIDFTPRDAIGDAANAVALRAHQKGLELIVDIDAAVPQTLRGDPGRLRQILLNLLGNAIKFTHQGEVVLRVTSAVATPPDVVLHFSIRDTGIGIPLDRQQQHLRGLHAGRRLHDAQVWRHRPWPHHLVPVGAVDGWAYLGGERSRQGKHLPFYREIRAGECPCGRSRFLPSVDLRDVAVLIVDDNATNRHLLEGMLLGWRMAPTLAASVPDALAALRAAQQSGRPFTLVLADCSDARCGWLYAGRGHQAGSGDRRHHGRDAHVGRPTGRRRAVPGVGYRRVPRQTDQALGPARRDPAGIGCPVY